ncbi:MAG TPA: hypothetical protein ENI45_02070 [Thermoplasmatales archaeon]|nr:hypothetical protein [Thermoplasmatales archaeon]
MDGDLDMVSGVVETVFTTVFSLLVSRASVIFLENGLSLRNVLALEMIGEKLRDSISRTIA